MIQLLSAPGEIASWEWYVDIESGESLNRATAPTLSISKILERHSLLELSEVRVSWHRLGQGSIGFRSLVPLRAIQRLSTEVLSEQITSSQPAGFPDSHAGQIELLGSGYWINADGERKREEQLVNVSLLVTPEDISVALGIRHDIWMWFDFSGRPHQSIYYNNKPRLSETLKEISEVLKTDIIPGDPTYFATPEEDGIATPTPSPDGFGRDETHML